MRSDPAWSYALAVLRGFAVVALLAFTGCTADSVSTMTVDAAPATTTTVTEPETTTTLETIESCEDVAYRPLIVPERAAGSGTDPADLGDDPYTTIPGTTIRLWVDSESEPVMAIVRGALPPEAWAGPTARIEVLREPAALGPLAGGRWAVAWFESEERCDLYTLVLYPPTSAEEAMDVAESLVPDR